jgi:cobalt-zinc-cadmium efflux system membrane fusion protein
MRFPTRITRRNAVLVKMRIPTRLALICLVVVTTFGCSDRPADSAADTAAAAPTRPAVASESDWCAGCGLPESMCTVCNPELVEAFKAAGDWCAAHGFPESVCPSCHPMAPPGDEAQPVADWCLEHGLPESKCTKCNPGLVETFQATGDWCETHGFPESACPDCDPSDASTDLDRAALEGLVVRFRSPEIEARAGIETVTATNAPATNGVECTARIAFDADALADIRAIVPGIVRRIHAELGARVERGAPLFELESTRVGEIQGELQTARETVRTAEANLARLKKLQADDIASARQVEIAERELAGARAEVGTAEAALRMAGADASSPSGLYTLTSPISGTVVRRPAVVGVLATESASLATIADTSVMWALCDVPEAHAARVSVGQEVVVTLRHDRERSFRGELTWIAAEVDPRTRTVAARAEIPNADGRLRANQFAQARIETDTAHEAVSVPRAAVQRVENDEVVFVRRGEGLYESRVVTRHGDGEVVHVAGRLRAGEQVVTTGAVLLRTEVMPGSIGAGCCEIEPARKE